MGVCIKGDGDLRMPKQFGYQYDRSVLVLDVVGCAGMAEVVNPNLLHIRLYTVLVLSLRYRSMA